MDIYYSVMPIIPGTEHLINESSIRIIKCSVPGIPAAGNDNKFISKVLPKAFLLIALLICLIFSACSAYSAEKNPRKTSFMPQWVPQAQFAGYYVAHDKGIYRKYGLSVDIRNGGPQISPCALLHNKECDFINISLNTGIEARANGLKLVNIGQLIQKSAMMLVAKKSSGIKTVEDLNNKRIGVWTGISKIQTLSFIKKYNLDVEIIPQTYSINLFLRDGVDAASAMWYNEYHTILNSGYDPEELVTFFFCELDVNFPEDGIYALEETCETRPDFCRNFVKASIEGWMYAFNHPKEAVDIVLKYAKEANIPANRVHQKWMLKRMKDLMLVNGKEYITGVLEKDDYYRVAGELKSAGMTKEIPDYNLFYKGFGDYNDKK